MRNVIHFAPKLFGLRYEEADFVALFDVVVEPALICFIHTLLCFLCLLLTQDGD